MEISTLESLLPYLPVIWVVFAAILALIEAFTLGLTTIWFAVGAACAAIVAGLGGPIWLQIVIFFLVSIITLALTRPIAVKKLKVGRERNRVEQMIGEKGMVIEDIKPFSTGKVKCGSLEWSAVGLTPEAEIPAGSEIKVEKIEGVKLIVIPAVGSAGSV